jgi:hypothetical protein
MHIIKKMNLQHDEEYIHNAVIPPPNVKPDFETFKKYNRVVVDSKDRDMKLFPNPNSYEITLYDDIEDVLNVQLLNISVPLSSYLINNTFNTFQLTIGDTTSNITLDKGDYSATELAAEITSKMNIVSNKFLCEYVPKLDHFIFRSKIAYSIDFTTNKNSLAPLLGFDIAIYNGIITDNSTYPYVIESPYRKNFDFNNYIIMNIDQFDINKSSNTDLNRSFAIIPANYNILNISDDPIIKKYFSPPLARLSKLRIRFFDRFGNPYEFNNLDHHFELIFESMKQKRKYQNIFFNR